MNTINIFWIAIITLFLFVAQADADIFGNLFEAINEAGDVNPAATCSDKIEGCEHIVTLGLCQLVSGCDETCGFCQEEQEYDLWDCEQCMQTPGYTFCKEFDGETRCLPNWDDGYHVPCGEQEGDSVVTECDYTRKL